MAGLRCKSCSTGVRGGIRLNTDNKLHWNRLCVPQVSLVTDWTRGLSEAEDFSLHTGLGADECNSQGVHNESSAT